jgi:hypothetical protein
MPPPRNAMEIFRLLDHSNCRKCGEKTCLAFAGAVYTGKRQLRDCPLLDADTIQRFSGEEPDRKSIEQNREDFLEMVKKEVAGLDLEKAADRVGGRFSGGRLTVKVFGKDFSIDREGRISTDIHVNPWVAMPFLHYILHGEGRQPLNEWVPFRELKNGQERYPLFQKRCEEAIKKVADVYTDLFDDMVHLFGGRKAAAQFQSDIAVVLHPLPKVPLMVCYWRPEDGLASSLNLFFDRTAEDNMGTETLFTLGAGLAQMFEKLAMRHGFVVI